MNKFSEWLAEKAIDTKVEVDNAAEGQKITANVAALTKSNHLEELEAVAGKITDPNIGYTEPKFKGLFYKEKVSSGRTVQELNLAKGSEAINALLAAGGVAAENTTEPKVKYTFQNGDYIEIRISTKSISRADGRGATDALGDITEVQESIAAALMEMRVKGITIPAPKNKKYAKYSVAGWIIESDPKKKTGVYEWVKFNSYSPAVQQQLSELLYKTTAANSTGNGWTDWAKSFEAIYSQDWKAKLNAIYKTVKPNWNKASFIHHRRIIPGLDMNTVYRYLEHDRFKGIKKDEIDKTDIILSFDNGKIINLLNEIMESPTPEEHNRLINQYVNDCRMVGISLKQVQKTVNVAALNFKIGTTATGDNINDDYKLYVAIDKDPSSAKNTFTGSVDILSPKKEQVTSYVIELGTNHNHNGHDSLHLTAEQPVWCNVMINKGSMQVAYKYKNANAKFGDGSGQFRQTSLGNISKRLHDYEKSLGDKYKAVKQTVEDIADFFKNDPTKMAEMFAFAAGYPIVRFNKNKKLQDEPTQAPYIKVY